VSTLLATLPMVGGVPDGRVLLVPMLASVPLVASAIDYAFGATVAPQRTLLRAGGGVLVFMHLVVALLGRVGGTELMVSIGQKERVLAESVDTSRCAAGSPLYVVSGADPALCLSGGTSLRYYRPDLATRHPSLTVLSMAPEDLELARRSERELVLTADGSPRRSTMFEELFRDTPLVNGQSVRFERLGARVLATERGLYTRVSFDLPENACLLTLEHARLIGRPEPAVGTSVHVPHEPGPLGI